MIESLNHCKRVRRLLLLCFLTMSESHERMSPLSLQRRPLSVIQNGEETEAYKTSLFLSQSSPTIRTNLSMRGGGLISYIKASKSRCWALLVVSIMIEAAATTLNKRASDTQSAQLFAGSCILFLIWLQRGIITD
ncbi:hypothetical protein MPSEU_000103200 [Mayamaea pseudoterrestris]|nr:hypothetical protein MPSEU_000103200 [Mayamaea pseudoterrestris]